MVGKTGVIGIAFFFSIFRFYIQQQFLVQFFLYRLNAILGARGQSLLAKWPKKKKTAK